MRQKIEEFIEFNNTLVEACECIFALKRSARSQFLADIEGGKARDRLSNNTYRLVEDPFQEEAVRIFTDEVNEGYMDWDKEIINVYGRTEYYGESPDSTTSTIPVDILVLFLENRDRAEVAIIEDMRKTMMAYYTVILEELKVEEDKAKQRQEDGFVSAQAQIKHLMREYGVQISDLK